jgi:myo-inositol-1(or 4)-monophosphatase
MEEGAPSKGDPSKPRWIIDPIDGTSNFIHGIPHFAISIAVEEPKLGGARGDITQGLVYQPLTDESFWAEKGRGSWLNERRLRVSSRRDMSDALIATGIPYMGSWRSRPLPAHSLRRLARSRGDPPLRLGSARSRLGGCGAI